uniref:BRX domain-containing protein n=1 Tax=Arundo donax TaxID=35708 RepID=A0A0A9CR14_ARUDO
MIRSLDIKAARQGKKTDGLPFLRSPQLSSLLHQLSDIALSGGTDMNRLAPRAVRTSAVRSVTTSRAVSPFSRKPSPPRSTTPVPTGHGLSLSKSATDNLVKANELLTQEVERLHAQVDNMRNRCELRELELQKSAKKVQEAMTLVAEESAKSKAAKEVIKSLTAQLKDMAERLPPEHGSYNVNETKQVHVPNGIESHVASYSSMNGIHQSRNELLNASTAHSPNSALSSYSNGISGQHKLLGNISENSDCSIRSLRITSPHESELPNRRACSSSDEMLTASSRVDDNVSIDARSLQNDEDGYKPRGAISLPSNQVQAEWIEQYEPGVYITLTTLRDGTRDLKRVRFSRRRFGEHQAENWWNENRDKVYERYNVKSSERVSSAASTRSAY